MLVLADCLKDKAGWAIYCSACLFCDKGCSDSGGRDQLEKKLALLCFVMSVEREDSLISHKGSSSDGICIERVVWKKDRLKE